MNISYQGAIQSLSITNFIGYSQPLSAMMASISSEGAHSQFYQSACYDSNSVYSFNMGFSSVNASKILDQCDYYNSPSTNVFMPYETFIRFENEQSAGMYTVTVAADDNIQVGYVNQVDIQVCVYVNYLIITTDSEYVNPGGELNYAVVLGVNQNFGSFINITLSCGSESVNDTILVYHTSIDTFSIAVPSNVTGICTLYAAGFADSPYIVPAQVNLTVTNQPIMTIISPRSGQVLYAPRPILVTINSTEAIDGTTGTVTVVCSVGQASATGAVPGRLLITPEVPLYGNCVLRLQSNPDYATGYAKSFTISRRTVILSPVANSVVIAGQNFTILITAPYAYPRSPFILNIVCGDDAFEYGGEVDKVYSFEMYPGAVGSCTMVASVQDCEQSIDESITILSPLIISRGLPNPSRGGETYKVKVDTLPSLTRQYAPIDLVLSCATSEYKMSWTTNTLANFTIPSFTSGIGYTFGSQNTTDFYIDASQTLNVLMSTKLQELTIAALGPSNFANNLQQRTENRRQKTMKMRKRQ